MNACTLDGRRPTRRPRTLNATPTVGAARRLDRLAALLVFAAAVLLTPDTRAQDGLLGEYYDDTSLLQLVELRIDPNIDFLGWQGAPPGTAVTPDENYGERWTGYVRVDQAGSWTFSTNSNDGVRLWIGDELVIDNWGLGNAFDSGSRELAAGWHALRLEHFQLGGNMAIQLLWEGPGRGQEVVPADHLSTAPAANLLPTIDAGPDKVVALPSSSVNLSAAAQDPDGDALSVHWIQTAGPPVQLLTPGEPVLVVDGITQPGDLSFRVTAYDGKGGAATDQVGVSVVECLSDPAPTGVLRPWHRVSLDFHGPLASEHGATNPFLDYRLQVLFTHGSTGRRFDVPGFFAADGDAAETGAHEGDVWRVHFTPDMPGTWSWVASFRAGQDVAVSLDPYAGTGLYFDGAAGCFEVASGGAATTGFRAGGRLAYTGEHLLRHAGSGAPFLKGGANSPENLLAFADFDQTPPSHHYEPHVADWRAGDPTWHGDKGKGLVGALNYLADSGMNAVSFLTFNVGGDGEDVWPWLGLYDRLLFDCSKLDQWELVFEHMDRLGLLMHVVTQEEENDTGTLALDEGQLGIERKLYYRELVARFGHHLGLVWDLGEQNTNTTEQRQDFYDWFRDVDPYDHPIVMHAFADEHDEAYGPLLDVARLEGAALQHAGPDEVHADTSRWRVESAAHGRPWVVTADETGPSLDGLLPDSVDPDHDVARKQVLWANLMAGGAGVEWYFGYGHPDDDLDCEDWRTRDAMWAQTRHALEFFERHLPYDEMTPRDDLVTALGGSGAGAWCLARPGEVYAVYLAEGGSATLDLGDSTAGFDVRWYDPRAGGPLLTGTVDHVQGPGLVELGTLPGAAPGADQVLLVEQPNAAPTVLGVEVRPDVFVGDEPIQALVRATDANGLTDIAAVRVHVFDPQLTYLGWVPCEPLGGGLFSFTALDVPPVAPGTWYAVGQVLDQHGAWSYLIATFEAQ